MTTEIKKVIEEDSREPVTEYDSTEKAINNKINSTPIPNATEYKFIPRTTIDTAHILLQNSETANNFHEIDNEIKLSNLNHIESYVSLQYMGILEDLEWIEKNQRKKQLEVKHFCNYENEKENIIDSIDLELDRQKNKPDYIDSMGAMRKIFNIATLGRAKLGFERGKQVETLNKTEQTVEDKTQAKPGFLGKFGGFKQ